jgi:hypothetical protein
MRKCPECGNQFPESKVVAIEVNIGKPPKDSELCPDCIDKFKRQIAEYPKDNIKGD